MCVCVQRLHLVIPKVTCLNRPRASDTELGSVHARESEVHGSLSTSHDLASERERRRDHRHETRSETEKFGLVYRYKTYSRGTKTYKYKTEGAICQRKTSFKLWMFRLEKRCSASCSVD